MSLPGFLRVQDFRTCTDYELQQVIAQAAVAAYILEQRECIAGMVRDHGAALDKLLGEIRALKASRVKTDEYSRMMLAKAEEAERISAAIEAKLTPADRAIAENIREFIYEPAPAEVTR